MSLVWHKVLPWFALPLGVSLMLFLWAVLRRKRCPALLGLLVLGAASCPPVGEWALRCVEEVHPRLELEQAPPTDAVVVLSGMLRQAGEGRPEAEWSEAADRFESGLRLLAAGRAPRLVFTAGVLPWRPEARPEGQWLAEEALRRGAPAEAVLLTRPVSDTAGEAREVARLARERGWVRVTLVTSAFHAWRAARVFRREGLEVVVFPCDYRTAAPGPRPWQDWLPTPAALLQTETALRELYGVAYYSVGGGPSR